MENLELNNWFYNLSPILKALICGSVYLLSSALLVRTVLNKTKKKKIFKIDKTKINSKNQLVIYQELSSNFIQSNSILINIIKISSKTLIFVNKGIKPLY